MGILMLFAAATAAGYMKSMSLKVRVETAEELLLFLAEYKAALGRSVVPLYVLVERLAEGGKYARLGFLKPWAAAMRAGAGPGEAWESLTAGRLPPGLCEGFAGFCGELGQSDRAAQEALCDAYGDVFAELREICRREYAEKGRLYRSLGLYAGAFLAVLLF
ncbi:MAG: stage III sporulation protein AB [Candidatus Howiella sp.]